MANLAISQPHRHFSDDLIESAEVVGRKEALNRNPFDQYAALDSRTDGLFHLAAN